MTCLSSRDSGGRETQESWSLTGWLAVRSLLFRATRKPLHLRSSPGPPPLLKKYPHHQLYLVPLPLPKHIAKLLQRAPVQLRVLPQIRRQEPICIAHRHERRFQRVLERLRRAGGGGVHVLDAGELEEALDGGGGDESGAAGGGDELLGCVYQPLDS